MISRRTFIRGATAITALGVAAGVGAGIDRLIANHQMEQLAAVTGTQIRTQINELTAHFGEEKNQALQESAANAQRDKEVALQQVEDQLPSGRDPMVSRTFAGQIPFAPWLNDIRKSVGFLEYYGANGLILRGTAEIIDRDGTLVFAAHQFPDEKQNIKFSVTFFPKTGESYTADVNIKYIDRKRDLAFGAIQNGPRLMRRYGLQPVEWAPADTQNTAVFLVGFAEGEPRLHLVAATRNRFQWIKTFGSDGKEVFHDCMEVMNDAAFEGMSGGAVFQNGKFVGIINSSDYPGIVTAAYTTPAEVIRGLCRLEAKSIRG